MRVLVAGLGSIGRRHLANIRALEPDAEIAVLRHLRGDGTVPKNADRIVYAVDEAAAWQPQVAFVCGATAAHVDVALASANAGAHLFVEKPLAGDVAGARAIVDVAARCKRLLIVGYNLRFSAGLRAMRDALRAGAIGRPMTLRAEVGQYLPDWRPGEDYRDGHSARAELGGDVVLELSHEIDYARWLLGEVTSVDAITARLGELDIDVDDTAELLLRFAGGAVGSVHLDMVQRSATRTCRLTGTEGTLTWDALAGEVRLFGPATGWTVLNAPQNLDRNATYVDEAAHVFACVRDESTPLVDGNDGLRAVEIAAAARRASATRSSVAP